MAEAINTLPGEIWKPVVGWDGLYEVSSFGRVYRLPGFVKTRGKGVKPIPGGIRKTPAGGPKGYRNVMLCGGAGRIKTQLLHIIVCTTFHGPKPGPKYQVAHYDGDPSNNRADNLRWATAKENADDRARHGNTQIGEINKNAKLTAENVLAIRKEYKGIFGQMKELAKRYGVSGTQIGYIVHKKQWTHI
jgi:HNH endonuclease/NUMOD4 motif